MLQSFALYVRLCQVFGVRFRRFRYNGLTVSTDGLLVLNISNCNLSDGHALAFACAQFCCARVPAALTYQFIRTYLDTATSKDFNVCVRGALESRQVAKVLEEFNQSSSQSAPLPCAEWRLDHNNFTGRGAALLIAAAVALGDGRLELDLGDNPNIFTMELAPWVDIVRMMRGNSSLCGLRGLRMDNCKLRSLGRSPHELLSGIQWLSLRGTAISNLWTMASIISDLRSLRALLIQGPADPKVLERIKALSLSMDNSAERLRKRKTPLNLGNGSNNTRPSSSIDTLTSVITENKDSDETPTTDSTTRKIDNLLSRQSNFTFNAQSVPYLPTSYMERNEPTQDASGAEWTPVSRVSRYREFLLVHASEALVFLDEAYVTPQEIAIAHEIVSHYFELPRLNTSNPRKPLSKLIRDRELDVSGRTYLSANRKKSDSNPKRRRNANYMSNMGEPPSRNTVEVEDRLILDKLWGTSRPPASSKADGRGTLASTSASLQSLEQVVSLLTSGLQSKLSSRFSPLVFANPPASSSATGDSPLHARLSESRESASSSSGASPVNGALTTAFGARMNVSNFETRASEKLLSRTGFPRVEYLCLPHDRPRQFEYNETDTRLLVYGTEHANLVVLNQDTGTVVGSCSTGGGPGHIQPGTSVRIQQQELPEPSDRPELEQNNVGGDSVLGLSWFNKDPNLFISGSENGNIHVYNVDWMQSGKNGGCVRACDRFRKLTSLHTNCTDDKFLVSGHGLDVVLFDLGTGKPLDYIRKCHTQHINVLKFTNHDPNVFVTSSFDTTVKKWDLRERRSNGMLRPVYTQRSQTGNVMVCFSPDDKYFLASAWDNEVNQFETSTGHLDRTFKIPKTSNKDNYTRSYYMNGHDYIISGSCTEDVVRIYNSQTGRLYREIEMDNRTHPWSTMIYVQSLRANPRKSHCFSTLLSSNSRVPYNVIASVDLHTRI